MGKALKPMPKPAQPKRVARTPKGMVARDDYDRQAFQRAFK